MSLSISDNQRRTLRRWSVTGEDPQRTRAAALLLIYDGHSQGETASLFGVSRRTVYAWIKRFNERGVYGLKQYKSRAGRPHKITPDYLRYLHRALDRRPYEFGYQKKGWSVDLLRTHLYDQTGIRLSYTRLRELLVALDYVYVDLRYAPPLSDNPIHIEVWYEDWYFTDDYRVRKTWVKRCDIEKYNTDERYNALPRTPLAKLHSKEERALVSALRAEISCWK